jgi:hypothetical protein
MASAVGRDPEPLKVASVPESSETELEPPFEVEGELESPRAESASSGAERESESEALDRPEDVPLNPSVSVDRELMLDPASPALNDDPAFDGAGSACAGPAKNTSRIHAPTRRQASRKRRRIRYVGGDSPVPYNSVGSPAVNGTLLWP